MSLQELKQQVTQLPAGDRLVIVRAIIESLQESQPTDSWQFLVSRPHPWRRQLYVKGRKLLASTLWQDALTNQLTPEQTAENWDLPLAAIQEAMHYCETHQDLLQLEAAEERYRLQEAGISFESNPVTR